MKRWLLSLVGCCISAFCLVWLSRRVDLGAVRRTIVSAGPGAWCAASVIYLGGFLPRALRWRLMLLPAGRFRVTDLWRCIILGYTGNNLFPFRLGEVIRAATFSRLTGASCAIGLASVVAERLLDGMTLVLLLFVVLLGSTSAGIALAGLRTIYLGAGLIVTAGLAAFACAWFAADAAVRTAGRVSPRLGRLAANCVTSARFLRDPRIFATIAVLSLFIWMIEGSMFVVIAAALGLPSPVAVGFLSLVVINLGILIPSAPGYIGIFQAAAILSFVALRQPESQGLAFGILVHSAQFIPLTLLGLTLAVPLWGTLPTAARAASKQ